MGVVRRMFPLLAKKSIFRFKIDTRFTNPGATDGSQLDNQFILPTYSGNMIVKVNDGRPDIILNGDYVNLRPQRTLTFAVAGEYEITVIGRSSIRFSNISPDQRKIIWVYECGDGFRFLSNAFAGAINMIWDAPHARMNILDRVFIGIKGFGSNADLSKYTVDLATDGIYVVSNTINPITSLFQGFFLNLTSAAQMYRDCNLSPSISKIEMIAPNLTTASSFMVNTNFKGRLIIKSNVLTNISQIMYNGANPPPLGGVDIRNVTSSVNIVSGLMSKANVDSTLLEWANDYDWSAIPNIPNKTTINFNFNTGACTCSNTPAVVNALNFLKSKGYLFPYLTAI